ncbi:thiol S-methyltransferase TMT1A-like [Phalacrocorax carbo]|uniref:thiol S-methyltransferase TMT1A-like n=1 Tax=Phalacrocorax carbo TaxID=9209 RepID=UPI003119DEEA
MGLLLYILPYIMAKGTPIYNHKVYKRKQELFSTLRKFAGPLGQLTLLEIGTGTGTNFQFHPPGCRLTCTNPNPDFRKFLLKSLSENQQLKLERLVVASGEELHRTPGGTVDAVVRALSAALGDRRRGSPDRGFASARAGVNSPQAFYTGFFYGTVFQGGAFYFLEHVAADHSSCTYFWQKICDPVWKYFGDGCSLSRETQKELEKTNFSELNLRRIHVTPYWIPTRPHIIGYTV